MPELEPLFAEMPTNPDEAGYLVLTALKKYAIPIEAWDSGDTKTLPEFLEEVWAGELVLHAMAGFVRTRRRKGPTAPTNCLVVTSNRTLTYVSRVNPRTNRPEEWIDALQVYPPNNNNLHGRIRQRWVQGLREKMHPGESHESALVRSVYEESGNVLRIPANRFSYIRTTHPDEPKPSKAYPGIFELRTIFEYALQLTPQEAALSRQLPETLLGPDVYGFTEEQTHKTCYALWREAPG